MEGALARLLEYDDTAEEAVEPCPTVRLMGSSPFTGFFISALLDEADVGLLRLRNLEKRFDGSAEELILMRYIFVLSL